MKKILALAMAAVLCLGLFAACSPADGGNGTTTTPGGSDAKPLAGTYTAKVWVAEAAVELTKSQIKKFNETNTDGIIINADVQAVGEGDAATQMTTDIEAGADIYCFAQDQAARLIQGGALAQLGVQAAELVKNNNDAGTVSAATSGDALYAYPLTADNGYFLYYDKSVISDAQAESLEEIIAACEAAGKNFSFELEGSAWYTASFFFATKCQSTWKTDDEGNFIDVTDDFNSNAGLIALKGMKKLLDSTCYNNSSAAEVFAAAIPSAALVSGIWAYEDIKAVLGDNIGITDLPSFTVDGNSYHLGSFNGCKLMGVKPQADAKRAAALHKLAQYLTGEEAQMERFNTLSWGPSNLKAQASDAVKANPGLVALAAQGAYSVPQGQIHGSWWDIAKLVATNAKAATDEAGLQGALDTYTESMEALFTMSDEAKKAWAVIGNIDGDGWTLDLPMVDQGDGTWKTDKAYELTETTEFKVRQGKSWDNNYGANGEFNSSTNISLASLEAAPGTYYIVFDSATGIVTLVAA